jgi:hypothetical protein
MVHIIWSVLRTAVHIERRSRLAVRALQVERGLARLLLWITSGSRVAEGRRATKE